MKNLIILSLSSFLCFGCSTKLIPTERKVYTYVFDFRDYNKEGFFISTTPYIGLYDPLGEINIHVYPAKEVVEKGGVFTEIEIGVLFGKPQKQDVYEPKTEKLITEIISTDELLRIIVDEAKKLGADGLVNASIKDESYSYFVDGNIRTEFLYYKLSGLAIKRK